MFEIAVYETRKRIKGTLVLIGGLTVLIGMFVWIFPSIETSGIDLEKYAQSFPPALREMFGIKSMGTIEGFLSAEVYAFAWIILLALYFAYSAASSIAGDIEDESMDILLSLPVSRFRILIEKFMSLFIPILLLNIVTPLIVYFSLLLINEPISVIDLVAVHFLSIPYLLTCASVGLLMSVIFNRESTAQKAAMGIIFGLFLVESVVGTTDYAEIGVISPTRYYEPSAILVDGSYDIQGSVILLLGTFALVAVSVLWFRGKDIE